MANISEDYVSFETAKLLKEKGFDERVNSFYPPGDIQRPTIQRVMKWFRIVHKLGIFPSTYTNIRGNNVTYEYGTAIVNLNTYELMTDDILGRDTYEKAAEAAMVYCLEKLI